MSSSSRPGHHDQHGHHGEDFDWEAMADRLELEATVMRPAFAEIVAGLDPAGVRRVLDVGCGPGVTACDLARHFPDATVVAVDSSAPLLSRLRDRAAAAGLDGRVVAVEADLAEGLERHGPADVVWASLVLHHLDDTAAVLEDCRAALAPGGTLVAVEFGEPLRALPPEDPIVADGVWARWQSALAAARWDRLPPENREADWAERVTGAGFSDVTTREIVVEHPAPLDELTRRWLAGSLHRSLEFAAGHLDEHDAALLEALVAGEGPDGLRHRADVFARAGRLVVTGRRPA